MSPPATNGASTSSKRKRPLDDPDDKAPAASKPKPPQAPDADLVRRRHAAVAAVSRDLLAALKECVAAPHRH